MTINLPPRKDAIVEKTIDALWPSIVRVALPVARPTGNVTQT